VVKKPDMIANADLRTHRPRTSRVTDCLLCSPECYKNVNNLHNAGTYHFYKVKPSYDDI